MCILITDGLLRHILPVYQDLSLTHIADSRDGMYQFSLSVAVDTGNADDLTGADVEADMVHGVGSSHDPPHFWCDLL